VLAADHVELAARNRRIRSAPTFPLRSYDDSAMTARVAGLT
jgi:hypothetical protein